MSVDVSATVLVQEVAGEVLGVAAGAGGAELLVSVQGDGVLAFDAVKQVRCRRVGGRLVAECACASLWLLPRPGPSVPPKLAGGLHVWTCH